jgi:hypothetical protein
MNTEEKQFVTELLDLMVLQNDALHECNNVFHNVIMTLNQGHRELKSRVEKLKDGMMKVKTEVEEIMKNE